MIIEKNDSTAHEIPSFMEIMEADDNKLSQMYQRFLRNAFDQDQLIKDKFREMLMLMEGAPELKDKILKIKIDTYNDLETQCLQLQKTLDEQMGRKSGINKRLLELNQHLDQAASENSARESNLNQNQQDLEQINRCVDDAKHDPRQQWIIDANQWDVRIEEKQQQLQLLKSHWDLRVNSLLAQCKEFFQNES